MDLKWADKFIDYVYNNCENKEKREFIIHYTISPLKYIKKHGVVLGSAYFINTIDNITTQSQEQLRFINKLFSVIDNYRTSYNYYIEIRKLTKLFINGKLIDKSLLNMDHNERINNIKNNIQKNNKTIITYQHDTTVKTIIQPRNIIELKHLSSTDDVLFTEIYDNHDSVFTNNSFIVNEMKKTFNMGEYIQHT
jgi:hypothetical protein